MGFDLQAQRALICLKVLADNGAVAPSLPPSLAELRTHRILTQLYILGIDDATARTLWPVLLEQGWVQGDPRVPGTLWVTWDGYAYMGSLIPVIRTARGDEWYTSALRHLFQR